MQNTPLTVLDISVRLDSDIWVAQALTLNNGVFWHVTPFADFTNTISTAVLVNAGRSSKMPIFLCWLTRRHIQKALLLRCGRKIAKATISFVVSVCLSVHMEHLGFHCTDFHEIWYLSIFRKPVEKIQFVSYLTRVTDTLHEDVFIYGISLNSS